MLRLPGAEALCASGRGMIWHGTPATPCDSTATGRGAVVDRSRGCPCRRQVAGLSSTGRGAVVDRSRGCRRSLVAAFLVL